jgi:hypothetical protein
MNIPPHPIAAAAPAQVKRSTRPENGVAVEIFDRRQRFQIATPAYGNLSTEVYLESLRACERAPSARFRNADGSVSLDTVFAGYLENGSSGRLTVGNDSHIDRARNILANHFVVQNQTDWLLWVDGDIQFLPPHIARLFQHAMNGYKMVAGHYAMKCLQPTFVANVARGGRPDPTTGLIELADAGTGFLLMHRDVFLALQDHPEVKPYICAPNTPFAGQIHFSYFGSGVYGPKIPESDLTPAQLATLRGWKHYQGDGVSHWLSEDWKICRFWQELGGKVYGDTEIKLRHFGNLLYPPTVAELEGAVIHLLEHNHPAVDRARLAAALKVAGASSSQASAAAKVAGASSSPAAAA